MSFIIVNPITVGHRLIFCPGRTRGLGHNVQIEKGWLFSLYEVKASDIAK
jgi:hypothetical protein